MKLPNGEKAVVAVEKLRNYCLDSAHPRGRHKARVFAAALGWTANDAELLRRALLAAARQEEVIPGDKDEYGDRYAMDISLPGPHGLVPIRAFWMIRAGEDYPRLTTCFVL